jgi:hypothetical protein
MVLTLLTAVWFVVFLGGGVVVATNYRDSAERVFSMMKRYSFSSIERATPTTVRIIASGFVVIALGGSLVITLQGLQGK